MGRCRGEARDVVARGQGLVRRYFFELFFSEVGFFFVFGFFFRRKQNLTFLSPVKTKTSTSNFKTGTPPPSSPSTPA